MPIYDISPTWITEVREKARGGVPTCDNSSINSTLAAWKSLKAALEKSANAGKSFDTAMVSTYSLVYTGGSYVGGVLAPNGDIHFVPYSANRGQKISSSGVVSTYSLVYTGGSYIGGVLAPNGDIHLVPYGSVTDRGQKISTLPGRNFSSGLCLSPFLNKL